MNKSIIAVAGFVAMAALSSGCGSSFWKGGATGAAVGVVGTGAGYELRARQQMAKLEEEYKAGSISQHDYEIRKDQIQRGSIFY